MSEPFLAEIRIFAGNFAPRGWAFCNGQLLPIAQNTALFSLIGTTYGGDGRTTTALPNLKGRAPMHPGRGPGLTARRLGQRGGTESITLTEAQMPSHTHTVRASAVPGNNLEPVGHWISRGAPPTPLNVFAPPSSTVPMNAGIVGNAGGSQPHNNMQPFLAMNFIIALVGLYPSRG
ncbi:MAG: phage tail protein [Acidobacteria bacterium]|nr:MAG: phage tail protein [Acidobacteriota bacterium]